MNDGRAKMAFSWNGAQRFGDNASCASLSRPAEGGTGGAQYSCGKEHRIFKVQATGMDGKRWHELGDMPDKIKGLLTKKSS
jgi:hypothetical protein